MGWQEEHYRDHQLQELPLELCFDRHGKELTNYSSNLRSRSQSTGVAGAGRMCQSLHAGHKLSR